MQYYTTAATEYAGYVLCNSVSATILKKKRPALFVSGWFMLTAATVVCSMVYSSSQVLWVSLASHNQLRDTQLVVEMWLYWCTQHMHT